MRYVIVVSCEVENQAELAEIFDQLRTIPNVDGTVYLAINDKADRVLAEFKDCP